MDKISEPGVYTLPIDAYHGDICVGHSASHSSLDLIFQHSAAHYWEASYANPDREEFVASEAVTLGRAAHHLFLGETEFAKEFVLRPEEAPDGRAWNGNNKSCKEWIAEQERKGMTILLPSHVDKIKRMRDRLGKEPLIQAGLLSGKVEQSLIWQDEETGIWLKARPDVIPTHTGDFADLKIVADISDDGIQRNMANFGYHRQAALVLEGAHKVLKFPLRLREPGEEGMSFTFVFVESKRPHCVEIVTLRSADIEAGMAENRMALRYLKRCLDTNEWPGPSGHQRDARYLGLSKWAAENNEFRCREIERLLAVGTTAREEMTDPFV